MERPKLLSTSINSESFAGYSYYLDGELVPTLTVDLQQGQAIFFEPFILLSKNPGITIRMQSVKGMMKRMMAGMPFLITEAAGPGQISFSRDGAGSIIAMPMKKDEVLHVREHQFLAASGNIEYTYERIKFGMTVMFGSTGFYIDKFRCANGDGILWLHGYGNVFEKVLAPGEQIDVEPGGWLYKDTSVAMETNFQKFSTGMLSGMNLVMNRFTGPGRVGIQSMCLHMLVDKKTNDSSSD